jgi:predicted TIM-barrel fold metal-dependent hydrolase
MQTRRQFLTGMAALGAATAVSGSGLSAQAPAANPRRLDLHHHFGSPRWIKRIAEIKRQGWEAFQGYTPAKTVEALDKAGIETAFVSCTEPGIWYGDNFAIERDEAISMARDMNEYGARMKTDFKGRFGLFAVLPLPDVDASLKEIAYAFDTLKADGVGLLTSYGDMWQGDKRLQPVFDELNRRNAIVYTHPTDASCCHSLGGLNPGTLEWFTDTARTILSLVAEGPALGGRGDARAPSPATRYSNIKFIWSHGGGTLIAATRIVGAVSEKDLSGTPPVNSHLHHVRRFYYDTAGAANPIVMQGLKKLLGGTSHIVFGTDHPYGNIVNFGQSLQGIGFTAAELRGVDRENALAILPQYRS